MGKRGKLGHDPLVSSFTRLHSLELPESHCGRAWLLSGSLLHTALESQELLLLLSLESGMLTATCPRVLHYPWLVFLNLASTFISDLFIKYSAVILLQ